MYGGNGSRKERVAIVRSHAQGGNLRMAVVVEGGGEDEVCTRNGCVVNGTDFRRGRDKGEGRSRGESEVKG